jgi:hypothetical protein
MNLKKITSVAAATLMFLGTSSYALLPSWTGEGRVSDVFVGAAGVYIADPAVVFNLTGGTGTTQFIFALQGEIGRAMLSQVYSAKINGYWVQVNNDATGTIGSFSKANRILIQ